MTDLNSKPKKNLKQNQLKLQETIQEMDCAQPKKSKIKVGSDAISYVSDIENGLMYYNSKAQTNRTSNEKTSDKVSEEKIKKNSK